MVDPALDNVLERVQHADQLFIAPGYGNAAQLGIVQFSLKDLVDKVACPVEEVYED